jgi:hypothetical protein
MATEMRKKKVILATLVSAALMASGGWSIAQEKPQPSKPGAGMRGMEGMQGMQGMEGMMGMMDMMSSCNRMMQGGSMGHGMPQLPPGNAKLQLQMHAEMMQKMGEVLAKYAAQIREEKK